MGRRPTIDREDLLDAAEAVVAGEGSAHLTLDAVSERAGVSKGGLLHTFPSKDALLQAMVDRLCARFEAANKHAFQMLPETTPARALQAHVLASLTGVAHDPVSVALLAAGAQDLRLLAPLRERYAEAVREVTAGGVPYARAAVVCLAADGLWLFELLGISPLSPEERQEFLEELRRLAREGAEAAHG